MENPSSGALCTHWEPTHADHGDASDISQDKRKELGLEAAELGIEVERAMLACMGVDKQRTYAHDIMYGLPKLYRLLGKPYIWGQQRGMSMRTRR